MEDTYKGESPSKKYARYMCWLSIAEDFDTEKFRSGKHLVLASREGGDISTLLGMGVHPKSIIAVEHSASAAHAAQEKYPQVRVVCRDVVKMAQECKRTLSSAYLDFCGTATAATITRIRQVVLHGLKDDAYLAVTVLSGREQGELREEILAHKAKPFLRRRFHDLSNKTLVTETISGIRESHPHCEVQLYRERLLAALADDDLLDVEGERIRAAQAKLYSDHSPPLVRMHYLREKLVVALSPHRVALHPIATLHYNSNTDGSNGVPMVVVVFKTRRFLRSMPPDKFTAYFNRFIRDTGSTRVLGCNMTDQSLRGVVLNLAQLIDDGVAAGTTVHSGISSAEIVAQMFNLRKETIIAWKAHRTRGTYGQESQC